jgi:hypothetical protein
MLDAMHKEIWRLDLVTHVLGEWETAEMAAAHFHQQDSTNSPAMALRIIKRNVF